MKEYYAKVHMSSAGIGYDNMFRHCEIIELQRPAKAGEIIDNMLILSEDKPFEGIINDFEEGHFVRAIPLIYISLCTSPFDLSEYNFEAICDEDGCTKWCNFARLPLRFHTLERAFQKGLI